MGFEVEQEYLSYLDHERHMYKWCLITIGGYSTQDAEVESIKFYPYEKNGEVRGLIFHDEAWKWALIKIKGENFWISFPELEQPSKEYRKESNEFDEKVRSRNT